MARQTAALSSHQPSESSHLPFCRHMQPDFAQIHKPLSNERPFSDSCDGSPNRFAAKSAVLRDAEKCRDRIGIGSIATTETLERRATILQYEYLYTTREKESDSLVVWQKLYTHGGIVPRQISSFIGLVRASAIWLPIQLSTVFRN